MGKLPFLPEFVGSHGASDAQARRVSLAELIRQSIDGLLAAQPGFDRSARKRRALAVVGMFRSDVTDLSARHDEYLAEAYRE